MTYDYSNGNNENGMDAVQDVREENAAEAPRQPDGQYHQTQNMNGNENFWREPLYREEEQSTGAYSPSYHAPVYTPGSTYFPPLSNEKPPKKQRVKKERKKGGFLRAAALVLTCVLLSSAACAAVTGLVMDKKLAAAGKQEDGTSVVVIGGDQASSVSSEEKPAKDPSGALEPAAIYELGKKQVVGIRTKTTTTNVFGQTTNSAVSGSGFVISEDGYILTNYHVVQYAAQGNELTVMFYGKEKTYEGEVVAYEANNDVAVVKIDATGLSPVEFCYDLQVGDMVFPIGNPLGELDYTMTVGYVSALDREIATEAQTSINMFQMDAAVNEGNSGGPVYNEYGQVIGIVTAKYADNGVEGLGFAIPIQDAVNIATDLIQYGYVSGKAYLGINGETVSSSAYQYYNLPYGVYVTNVYQNSCASQAGVKIGDIITKLGDAEITDYSGLKKALRDYSAGDEVSITIYRSGEYSTLTGVLGEKVPTEQVPVEEQEQEQTPQESQGNTITIPWGIFPWG